MPATARPTPEPGDTSAPLEVRFLGHATVLLAADGRRVLTDPFLRPRLGPLERHGPVPSPDALEPIDVVVVSHGHPDHFDRASLEAIPGDPVVIVPRGLGPAARRIVGDRVVELGEGETVRVAGIGIEAVPARHWISPGSPRATPVGYVLDLGRRTYFAGDTGRIPVPAAAAGVDLALLPVWTWGPHLGPGHLGPRSAADFVAAIGPAVAIPIHWGTLDPRRLHRVWSTPLTEPGDRFADHAGRAAPGVEVRVLRPGDAAVIGEPTGEPRA